MLKLDTTLFCFCGRSVTGLRLIGLLSGVLSVAAVIALGVHQVREFAAPFA